MDGIKTTSIRNPVRAKINDNVDRILERKKISHSTTVTGHTMSLLKKAIKENT